LAAVFTLFSFESSSTNINVRGSGLLTTKGIIEKIEGSQRITDGATQVARNYKPQIDISPDTEFLVQ